MKSYSLREIKKFTEKHNKLMMPLALLLGFIVDYITLNRVDQVFDNLVLFFYIFLSGLSLYILYGLKTKLENHKRFGKLYAFTPLVLQYAFGGLFSGLAIFYFRSGALTTSFPFIAVLIILMIGNEYFYRKFPKLNFQLTVFFIALISYSNLIIPVLFKTIGTFVFIVSTILAAVIMYAFLIILDKHSKVIDKKTKSVLESRMVITLVVFIILYFTNVIPPIPLSMKESVVGYSIQRTDQSYIIKTEKEPWYRPFRHNNYVLHNTNTPTYVFASIYAPSQLNTKIYHHWSYFDENKSKWVDTDTVAISITGGREGGYRGYSSKSNTPPGLWRVDVETATGQVIGRIKFKIESGSKGEITTLTY